MVREDGRIHAAHVPSSGRLRELLFPGNELWTAPAAREGRVTTRTVYLARAGEDLVCIHTGLSNKLAVEAWEGGILPELAGYTEVRREVAMGKSRFDLEFRSGAETCPAEVKCVTLVRDKIALFPDAPTARGAKHLCHLAEIARRGRDAALIFVVQHPGAEKLMPFTEQDPEFARALGEAKAAGVKTVALGCAVTVDRVVVKTRIMIDGVVA